VDVQTQCSSATQESDIIVSEKTPDLIAALARKS
jgi:hypothetical protein